MHSLTDRIHCLEQCGVDFLSTFFFSLSSDNQATGSTPSKAATPAARPKGSVIDLTEDDDDVQGKFEVQ